MTPSEYRYHIESIYAEVMKVNNWLMTDSDFKLFADMARLSGSGNLVLKNWKIYLSGNDEKTPEEYFDWFEYNRPDVEKTEDEKQDIIEEKKKKSPFDDVKRKVRMK